MGWLAEVNDRITETGGGVSHATRDWPTELDFEAQACRSVQGAREAEIVEASSLWRFATRATGWGRPPTSDLLDGTRRPAEGFDAAVLDEDLDDEFEVGDEGGEYAWDDGYSYTD
ncbi:hypothetical protein [Dactylosporangium sp. NPDC006015]|uniref:hypothetical protein n=1 Tax=Dactylosporangium sp. NPDC006015 TaxID=3154576 RepID=UPI0033B25829